MDPGYQDDGHEDDAYDAADEPLIIDDRVLVLDERMRAVGDDKEAAKAFYSDLIGE